jgi:hypothetical protein
VSADESDKRVLDKKTILEEKSSSIKKKYVLLTIQHDDNSADVKCALLPSPYIVLRKRFNINFPLKFIAKAKICYFIKHNPYLPSLKTHLKAPRKNMQMAKIIVWANKKEISKLSVFPNAVKGWHYLDIPVYLLKKGINEIEFSVANSGKNGKEFYPYLYFGVDSDASDFDRSMLSRDKGKTFIQFRGEYMIRLEIAVFL